MTWFLAAILVALLIVGLAFASRYWVIQPIRRANQRYYQEIETELVAQDIHLGQLSPAQWRDYLSQLIQAVEQGQNRESFLKGVRLVAEFHYHLPPYYGKSLIEPEEVKASQANPPIRLTTSAHTEGV